MSDKEEEESTGYDQPYQVPMEEDKPSSMNPSSVKDIIETTGNVNPSRFWMVAMVGLGVFIAGLIYFVIAEIKGGSSKSEIRELKLQQKVDSLNIELLKCNSIEHYIELRSKMDSITIKTNK